MRTIGDYEIQKEIGRGPRSTQYLAICQRDGREVILKEYVVPADTPDEFRDKYIARYLDECTWLQGVKHPNIIRVIEVIPPNPEAPVPVLVTEKLEKSLQRVLQETGTLDGQEVMAWMVEILSGIREFHKHQIIHRDIKPSNVMFNAAGRPKIIDLSIAVKIGQEITLKPDDISTQYAAPEMYRGRSGANFATDIYSTGFMVYELICGQERFQREFADVVTEDPRESLLRWMNWHCDETNSLRPLNEIVPEIPEHLSGVIAKMTAKNLAERYQTVREVLEDLFQQSYQQEDAFSLIISQYVSADYWRDQGAYKLNIGDFVPTADTSSRKLTEEELAEEFPTTKRRWGKDPRKWGLIAALVLAWLVLAGAWFGVRHLKEREIYDKSSAFIDQALEAYKRPDYPLTADTCDKGISYIKEVRREEKYEKRIAFFGRLKGDAERLLKLEEDLKNAMAARDAGQLDSAQQQAQKICDEKFERDEPVEVLRTLSTEKFADVQKRGCDLRDEVAKRIEEERLKAEAVVKEANQCADNGKFRQALYLLLTSGAAPERVQAASERVGPVVKKLDEGRTLYNQKRFVEARRAFQEAWERSEQCSVEADYFLLQTDQWVFGSLNPDGSQIAWDKATGGAESIERQLCDAMLEITRLGIRKADLAQQVPDSNIETLRTSSDSIMDRLTARLKEQKEKNARFFEPQPLPEIQFPIEDSKAYFINLLTDLACLRFRTEMALDNGGVAQRLFEQVRENLSEVDKKYYTARLLEQKKLGGIPSEAVRLYQEILADYPQWAECLWRLGLVYCMQLDDFKNGMTYLVKATQALPDNERYRWWAARMCNKQAEKLFVGKDLNGARECCEAALQFWPDFPSALYGIAQCYWGQKEMDKAREYYQRFETAYKNRKYEFSDDDINYQDWKRQANNLLK